VVRLKALPSPQSCTHYLAELLSIDTERRFGYADDICIYQASHSLDKNVQLLAADLRQIRSWGLANKVTFAPEKQEMIHLTRQRGIYAPPCIVDKQLTINAISPGRENTKLTLRWLRVWFDRRLTFKYHVATRNAKAAQVAYHIRSLAKTTYGPPASSLRKATLACIYPSLLYGTECWYKGRTHAQAWQAARSQRARRMAHSCHRQDNSNSSKRHPPSVENNPYHHARPRRWTALCCCSARRSQTKVCNAPPHYRCRPSPCQAHGNP
jgi:hypothetical protein